MARNGRTKDIYKGTFICIQTLDDHGNNLDSFRISLESFGAIRGPLLHKPVTGQELFFEVSYSKPALATALQCIDSSQSRVMFMFY